MLGVMVFTFATRVVPFLVCGRDMPTWRARGLGVANFTGTGTRWIDMLYLGSLSLVLGVGLWLFPSPSTSPLCTPGFVVMGSVFLAGSLLTGHRTKWKINRRFSKAKIR